MAAFMEPTPINLTAKQENSQVRAKTSSPFFSIGIDLGTTTCSLSYTALQGPWLGKVKTLSVRQWKEDGLECFQELLPSYAFIPLKHQIKNQQYGSSLVTGLLAKNKRFTYESRVIHSAKSWLCAGGIDPRAKFLPWHSEDVMGAERYSPIEISANYLSHLKRCWDEEMKEKGEEYLFEHQSIVITVPASFNEVATKLTLEAAALAAFPMDRTVLLEEPQAGFYGFFEGSFEQSPQQSDAFIHFLTDKLQLRLAATIHKPRHILVCDVGGGTTDFSLFCLEEINGKKNLRRILSGQHLLLGGDNIDLKVAHVLEEAFEAKYQRKLTAQQWLLLCSLAKDTKEKALASKEDTLLEVLIPASGSNLFQELMSIKVSSLKLLQEVTEGFFPILHKDQKPLSFGTPIRQLGLAYAEDPRITAQLVAFLNHGVSYLNQDTPLIIDALLFIGGSLTPQVLTQALTQQVASWQQQQPQILEAGSMELAVSRGAAIYGACRFWDQNQIHSAYPRSLFLAVALEGQEKGYVCLIQKGTEQQSRYSIELAGLKVLTEQQVSFEICFSEESSRFSSGQLILEKELRSKIKDLKPLPALKTFLKRGTKEALSCRIDMQITGSGGFFMSCVSLIDEQSWPIEFQLDSHMPVTASASSSCKNESEKFSKLRSIIDLFYGKATSQDARSAFKPSQLLKMLEQSLEEDKKDWHIQTLRFIWQLLKEGQTRRIRSAQHEKVWLSLSGFCLRPGFGDPLDEARLEDLVHIMSKGLCFPLEPDQSIQSWILWRRVAPGLKASFQEALFNKVLPVIRSEQAHPEAVLLAASLERVDLKKKAQLGRLLQQHLMKPKPSYPEAYLLALTRLSTRMPVYAGMEALLPPSVITPWINSLLEKKKDLPLRSLSLFLAQSARLIGSRQMEIDQDLRQRIRELFLLWKVDDKKVLLLETSKPLASHELSELLADGLPLGLTRFEEEGYLNTIC